METKENNIENSIKNNIEDFTIEINFGQKSALFRPWKGKERRMIQNSVKDKTISNVFLQDILLYNCMFEKVFLTNDEILYALIYLYSKNISDTSSVNIECSCSNNYTENILLTKVLERYIPSTIFDTEQFSFKSYLGCLS